MLEGRALHSKRATIRTRRKEWHLILLLVTVAVIAILVYLGYKGRTGYWPHVSCSFVGSRAVQDIEAAGQFGAPVVMYQGQYDVQYTVEGRNYRAWVNAPWLDLNKQFVQDRVNTLPDNDKCDVRYDPRHPANGIAHVK